MAAEDVKASSGASPFADVNRQCLNISVLNSVQLPKTSGTYFIRSSLWASGRSLIKSEGDDGFFQTSAQKLPCNWARETVTFGTKFELVPDQHPEAAGHAATSVFLEVFEKKKSMIGSGSNSLLGMVEIQLRKLDPSSDIQNFTLDVTRFKSVDGKGKVSLPSLSGGRRAGKLVVRVQWVPFESKGVQMEHTEGFDLDALGVQLDDSEPDSPNLLVLRIMSATGLRNLDASGIFSSGKSDPRVLVKIGGKNAMTWDRDRRVVSTRTIQDDLDPVWNEVFLIPCSHARDGSVPSLEFCVEDEDKVGFKYLYETLGKAALDLLSLPLDGKAHVFADKTGMVLLNSKGTNDGKRGNLNVALQWVRDSTQAALDTAAADAADDSDIEDEGDEAGEDLTEAEIAEAKEQERQAKEDLKAELGAMDVKSGDYQVQVHIIECRELAAKDSSGSSDPIVYVELFGQKFCTEVKTQSVNPVFDELFIFNKRNLDKEQFEEETIRVSVKDVDLGGVNLDLIGDYTVDLSFVYFRKDHELYRTWVGLVNDKDPENVALQGYMKISVQVIGPGDKLKVHDEREDRKKERAAEQAEGGGMAGMVIMPPALKREVMWLKTTVWRAQYLPATDDTLLDIPMIGAQPGIDAFYQVQHGTTEPLRTKVRTVKGRDRNQLSPVFNTELWLPITVPTSSQTIRCTMMDYEHLSANETVATSYFKWGVLDKIPGKRRGPFWQPLYGAVTDVSKATKIKIAIRDVGASTDFTAYYNKFPDAASTYRGRVLLSQSIVSKDHAPDREEIHQARPWKRRISSKRSVEPPCNTYVLACLVVSGSQLPQFLSASLGGVGNVKMQVKVSCGKYAMSSQRVANKQGNSYWGELLQNEDGQMIYPVDEDQVPDVFVHLSKGDPTTPTSPYIPMCFYRVPAAQLLKRGFANAEPSWVMLQEDKCLNYLPVGMHPGNVLISLALGTLDEWEQHKGHWQDLARKAQDTMQCHLRANLFQARDLPDLDFGGGVDPFFKVRFNGEEKQTEHYPATKDPLMYKTLTLEHVTVSCHFPSLVSVSVYDYDFGGINADYVGMFSAILSTEQVVAVRSKPDEPASGPLTRPPPKWYKLLREAEGDTEGEVLASFELLPATPGTPAPSAPSIVPEFRDMCLEILLIGVRSMAPFKFLPLQFPYLEFGIDKVNAGRSGEDVVISRETITTKKSKRPSGTNANFLELIEIDVSLPMDPVFACPLKVVARDERLAGLYRPVVGRSTVHLETRIPGSPRYSPLLLVELAEAAAAAATAAAAANATAAGDASAIRPPTLDGTHERSTNHRGQPSHSLAAGASAGGSQGPNTKADDIEEMSPLDEARHAEQTAIHDSLATLARRQGSPNPSSLGNSGFFEEAPVLTQEQNFEDVIRARTGAADHADAGVGVFGALSAVKKMDMRQRRRLMLRSSTKGTARSTGVGGMASPADIWDDEDEDPPEEYMVNREVLPGTLEEDAPGTPFETFPFFLGTKVSTTFMPSDFRQVGVWKGIVRIKENRNIPPVLPKEEIVKSQAVVVRAYILDAGSLATKDFSVTSQPGKSDPYLKVDLGKEKVSFRDEYVNDETECDFYKCVEFHAEIPGASQLKVHVYDHDDFGPDDLIGTTTVDVEDRWFDERWKARGRKARCNDPDKGICWDKKPLEVRPLLVQGTTTPQGSVRLWVDLLTPGEATAFPPVDISLPPSIPCEARLIIWKAKDTVAMDTLEQMNDMFVSAWPEGFRKQHTDIHWRASKGKASWNYRMKFKFDLDGRCQLMKFPYLHIQSWDKDIIGSSDVIAETVLDIGKHLRKVLKSNVGVEVFSDPLAEPDPDSQSEDEEGGGSDAEDQAGRDGEEGGEHDRLLPEAAGGADGGQAVTQVQPGGGDKETPQNARQHRHGGEGAVDMKQEDDLEDAEEDDEDDEDNGEAANTPLVPAKAARHRSSKQRGQKHSRHTCCNRICPCCLGFRGCCSSCPFASNCLCLPCCQSAPTEAEEDQEVSEMVNMIKDMTGFGDSRPRNSEWLVMEKLDTETGMREVMGKLCISLWVGPMSEAESKPAGQGRNDPNSNPFLPPPTGRLKFSLNPFVMGAQLCGPKICSYVTCCLLCIAVVLVMIFCQPVFNLAIGLAFG